MPGFVTSSLVQCAHDSVKANKFPAESLYQIWFVVTVTQPQYALLFRLKIFLKLSVIAADLPSATPS